MLKCPCVKVNKIQSSGDSPWNDLSRVLCCGRDWVTKAVVVVLLAITTLYLEGTSVSESGMLFPDS